MNQYGKIIAQLRRENNMTQAELGAKLNVTYQAVSKWENDQSQPDFSTMAQIAELFRVPITIFTDGNYAEPVAAGNAEPVLGYCTVCGNAVRADNVAQQRPTLICKHCAEDAKKHEEEARAQAEQAARRAEDQKRIAAEVKKDDCKRQRNRGLIWGAVIAVVVMALLGIGAALNGETAATAAPLVIVGGVFIYTFAAQLFWGGFIVDAVLFGGKIVGMPGVIFSLDLDGFIFLIAVKILFAVLRFFIFILTFLISAIFAIIVSPFTFFFAMHRVMKEGA